MLTGDKVKLKLGQMVRLISKPDGQHSQHYQLTVGKHYEILDFDGSNVITTSDKEGSSASYWRGRVAVVGQCECCDEFYLVGEEVKDGKRGYCSDDCLQESNERAAAYDKKFVVGGDFDMGMNH